MTELLTPGLALPAGGIAGALAIILVTLMKVRVQQRENENTWAKEHMDRLTRERDEADKRADLFVDRLDHERNLRIEAQNSASRIEGINQVLNQRVRQLEQEVLRLRAQGSPIES